MINGSIGRPQSRRKDPRPKEGPCPENADSLRKGRPDPPDARKRCDGRKNLLAARGFKINVLQAFKANFMSFTKVNYPPRLLISLLISCTGQINCLSLFSICTRCDKTAQTVQKNERLKTRSAWGQSAKQKRL